MEITVFASGSKGNCSAVSQGEDTILIDAGISMRRIKAGLEKLCLRQDKLRGILITHEHSDHIAGLPMLMKHSPLPVYTTHTIANKLIGSIPGIEEFVRIIVPEEYFQVGGFSVKAFKTPHDSSDSVGFRIEGDNVLGYATDTGMITETMVQSLSGADTAVIEANYDEIMLKNGNYPLFLKKRILSDFGHLSNKNCGILAKALAETGTKNIVIGHLSRENNSPEKAGSAVACALAGQETRLLIAPENGLLTVLCGGEKCRA